jgi:hypothetical protein
MEHTQTHSEHTHEGNHAHGQHNNAHHEAKAKLMGHAGALEAWLAPIFAQAPHIPAGGRKVIVDIAPWLSLIFGILGLLGLLSAGALGLLLSPLMLLSAGFSSLMFFVHIVLGIVSSGLSILSFNPLREMKKKGWDYAFYSMILGAVGCVVSIISMSYGSGVSNVLGIIIGAYILFEVREMYHK